MALHHEADITITVEKSSEPFDHVLENARLIFADHPNKEQFLDDRHEQQLPNYQQLKELGPHPLLDRQTQTAKRWIKIRIKVENSSDWITLTARQDNLYVKGFTNHHGSYELLEVLERKRERGPLTLNDMAPKELDASFVPLPWDLPYNALFQCSEKEEVEEELQKMAGNPEFVVGAVSFLSNYEYKMDDEESGEDSIAKRNLAGIIFMLCEYLRMDMRVELKGTSNDGTSKRVLAITKAQRWGQICFEMLKWRWRGFQDWITAARRLREVGMHSEHDALKLVFLVLNRNERFYANLEKNKPKPKGPGKRRGPGDKGTDGGGAPSHDKGTDGEGGASQDKEDAGKGEGSHSDGKQKSSQYTGAQDGHDSNSFLYNGRPRLQVLAVSANFNIEGINIYDWHRGQRIYRRYLVNKEMIRGRQHDGSSDTDNQEPLALIGPQRAIGTFGDIKLEIFRAMDVGRRKRKRTTQLSPPIQRVWTVHNSDDDDDKPTVENMEFRGELANEKVSITYMLIPNTLEARFKVTLLLEDYEFGYQLRSGSSPPDRCYDVYGFIKVHTKEMEDCYVELLSTKWKSFKVLCCRKTELPLLPLVCLPSADMEVDIELHLKPIAGQEVVLGPYRLRFNPNVKTEKLPVEGHVIEVTVNMTT